jgi:hypothetical protein
MKLEILAQHWERLFFTTGGAINLKAFVTLHGPGGKVFPGYCSEFTTTTSSHDRF